MIKVTIIILNHVGLWVLTFQAAFVNVNKMAGCSIILCPVIPHSTYVAHWIGRMWWLGYTTTTTTSSPTAIAGPTTTVYCGVLAFSRLEWLCPRPPRPVQPQHFLCGFSLWTWFLYFFSSTTLLISGNGAVPGGLNALFLIVCLSFLVTASPHSLNLGDNFEQCWVILIHRLIILDSQVQPLIGGFRKHWSILNKTGTWTGRF